MISRDQILEQTNQGLDIILDYMPQASSGIKNYAFKFKEPTLKSEKNASLGLQQNTAKTEWVIKDWASDDSWSCFDVVSQFENLDFGQAIKYIAERYNLAHEGQKARRYEYQKLPADPSDALKDRKWVPTDFTVAALKNIIFAKNVWKHLGKGAADGKAEAQAFEAAKAICQKYHFQQLASFSVVSKDKSGQLVKHQFTATDSYPIFVWNIIPKGSKEPTGWKFYEPFGDMRFSYYGHIPKKLVFGLDQIRAAHADLPSDMDLLEDLRLPDPSDAGTKAMAEFLKASYDAAHEPKKLSEVILCSGGTDALNVAAMGYLPFWMNGEHITPSHIPTTELDDLAHRTINLPDIDSPGLQAATKLAEQKIAIYTAYLPEELRTKWTGRYTDEGQKKMAKDVKDFFNHYAEFDFKRVVAHAKPFKFWTKAPKMNGKLIKRELGKMVYKYSPKPTYILNFLYQNGFAVLSRQKLTGKSREFVKIDANRVRKIEDTNEMKSFVDAFVAAHSFDVDLSDSILRSRDVADAIFSRLPARELDFQDYDKNYQYLFLANETWKISAESIEAFRPESINKFVWEHEVIKPTYIDPITKEVKEVKFSKNDAPFCITVSCIKSEVSPFEEIKQYDIKILSTNCLFLNYTINTSRIHWRIELEDRLDIANFQDPVTVKKLGVNSKEEYLQKYKFAIDGPLLTTTEIYEQKQCLIAKLQAIGKMMHRYKSMSTAMAVWSMDYVMKDINKSQGGTGKSLTPYCLSKLLPTETIVGRDRAALSNKHVFENISEDTDMLWLDDADKSTDFSFFYSAITGIMKKNPKGTKSENISFEDSPQVWITSNYPPVGLDEASTERRLLMLEFADYYHYNISREYREIRKPIDELGKELIRDFDEADWNAFLNTTAACCQSFIKYGHIAASDTNIKYNAFRSTIGDTFLQWADVYFNQEDGTLDNFICRKKMFEQFTMDSESDMKSVGFGRRVREYAVMKGWEFNPEKIDKNRTSDGRITAKQMRKEVYDHREGKWKTVVMAPKQMEFFYLQTNKDEPINYTDIEKHNPSNPANKNNELADLVGQPNF